MGASGAGKTTLLDVLASRVTMGVVTGQMLVDGRQRDSGFQRKTGYVQQQDLHLSTSTVREALNFSALLRQPRTTPKKEKLDYVDEVIKVLEMVSLFLNYFASIFLDLELRDVSQARHGVCICMPGGSPAIEVSNATWLATCRGIECVDYQVYIHCQDLSQTFPGHLDGRTR